MYIGHSGLGHINKWCPIFLVIFDPPSPPPPLKSDSINGRSLTYFTYVPRCTHFNKNNSLFEDNGTFLNKKLIFWCLLFSTTQCILYSFVFGFFFLKNWACASSINHGTLSIYGNWIIILKYWDKLLNIQTGVLVKSS